MATIGSLIIKILADADGLRSELQKAANSTQQFEKGVKAMGAAATTAFFSVVAGATALTISAGKQAEQLEQLASVTGINTDKLQEYEVMLNRAGLEGNDLALVMKQISTSLDQARQGTGTAGDRFRQLGIDIRTVTSTDDLIVKVAQASNRFSDGLQKAAVMSDLLGRGWQTFIRTFQGGRRAFDETAESSRKLGLTLSTSQLAVLGKMDKAVDDVGIAFKRFGQQLGVVLAPSIEMIANLLTKMLAAGSHAFNGLNLVLDIFATKLIHLGMKAQEIFGVIFSPQVLSGEAWKKALENITLIGKEEDKQIAKLRAAAEASRKPAPKDVRPEMPQMIDTAKVAQRQQALLDAQLRSKEDALKSAEQINRAGLQNELTIIDEQRQARVLSEMEANQMKQTAMVRADEITKAGLEKQLEVYKQFTIDKAALFTNDEKGEADRLKFLEESGARRKQIETEITLAAIEGDTTRRQSGMAIKSFWTKQLEDIAASNVFSTGIIISAWTGGVANAIVNGGNFIEATWKQTQIAVIQGALNLAVQWAATEALKVGATTAATSTIVALWEGTAAAITGTFAAISGAVTMFMTETVIPALVAIGEAIADFLFAIGTAETITIFGAEIGVATLVAAGMVLAAVGALAAFAFAEGGIVTGPTMGLVGEAGPEAVIPLGGRGAAFMRDAFGGGGGKRTIVVPVILKNREIARAVVDDMDSAWREAGLPA